MSRCVICAGEPVDGVPFAGIPAVSGFAVAPGIACQACAGAPEVLQRWLVQAEELDDDLGSLPADEMAEWLRAGGVLSELGALSLLEELCQTRGRADKAEESGRLGKATIDGWRAAHREAYLTGVNARKEADKVRRGARCLRERCRRLESRARGAEERADIARTAALYAWRMLFSADYPPFERGGVLAMLHNRVDARYGAAFAASGKSAWRMIDALGMWREEDGL